jgi:hypothetical protein
MNNPKLIRQACRPIRRDSVTPPRASIRTSPAAASNTTDPRKNDMAAGTPLIKRRNALARYLPLDIPSWMGSRQPLLPIAKIVVGSGDEKGFTPQSVRMLLQ